MAKQKHRLTQVNLKDRTGVCMTCGPICVSKKGRGWICKTLKDKHRGPRLPTSTPLFRRLRGTFCEICGATDALKGDHDHATGDFRGTLCHSCNVGLGFFKDKKALLLKAIDYLEK